MTRRPLDPRCVLVASVLVLTGCSSTADPPAPSTPASSVAVTTPAATDGIDSAVDVARVMRAGVDLVRSAQLTVDSGGSASADISGDGATTLGAGRLTGLEIDGPADAGDGVLVLRIVDGTAYVQSRDLDGAATGPWQRVTTTNPAAAGVRAAVAAVAAVADLGPLADALGAAATFDEVGTVGYGIRYTLADFAAGTALSATLGADVRPTNASVDLDPAGRPRAVDVLLTVDGARFAVRAQWSGFDQPVTIEPPAAGEIAG